MHVTGVHVTGVHGVQGTGVHGVHGTGVHGTGVHGAGVHGAGALQKAFIVITEYSWALAHSKGVLIQRCSKYNITGYRVIYFSGAEYYFCLYFSAMFLP